MDTLGDELSFGVGPEGKNLLDDINIAVQGHLFRQETHVKEELEGYATEFDDAINLEDPDDKDRYEAFLCFGAVDAINCSGSLISLFLDGDIGDVVACAMSLITLVEDDIGFLEGGPSAHEHEKTRKIVDLARNMARLMLQNNITEDQFEASVLVITRGIELHDETQLRLGARA